MDAVITDYKMPYMTGSDLLEEIKSRHPNTAVILITAYGTIEIAVKAMKSGAWDFLNKPVDLDILVEQLDAIDNYQKSRKPVEDAQQPKQSIDNTEIFITQDSNTQQMLKRAKKAAKSNASILITGETGVGKEVLANYIHHHSSRSSKIFLPINCASLPTHLIESELFGHEKGSFTGAIKQRIGHFEEADGGTLFLDEIGDLALELQVKLLRLLQSGEFLRIGSNKVKKSNVRILAATNIDLKHAMEVGEFREDLYFRLSVVQFNIPPLRERPKDIKYLADIFLKEFSAQHSTIPHKMSNEALNALIAHPFAGNVREIRNILERAVLFAEHQLISVDDLNIQSSSESETHTTSSLPDSVSQMERKLISTALSESMGNQSACARKLGISERVLRYKIQKYNLK